MSNTNKSHSLKNNRVPGYITSKANMLYIELMHTEVIDIVTNNVQGLICIQLKNITIEYVLETKV